MKAYSIGRDLNCDIVINDSTDVISRRHALLNITPSGKMTIIDQSSNGTYVNGIRITPNVPVPVTRKDIVSLAHVAKLDWNQVPRSNRRFGFAITACAVLFIILGTAYRIIEFKSGKNSSGDPTPTVTEQTDSAAIKQNEAAKVDSVKKVEKQDTIKNTKDKARPDSIKASKQTPRSQKAHKGGKSDDKSKDKKDKDKPSQPRNRAIG